MEKKIKTQKRSFSEEFKLEAIELAKKIGNSQAARELDLHESSIRTWKRKFEGPSSKVTKEKATYSDLEKENKKLKKENVYLKEIAKILKKSHGIFSQDHMGGLK